jgi:hypothetical protein
MEFKKKYLALLLATACVALGFISAKVLERYNYFEKDSLNIFEKTKNECPHIRWINPIDSSQMVFPITIEGELEFAGERVPLEDPDVRERLEREIQINAYWHSSTLQSMKLANRYFSDIEKILAEKGVPSDFKYLALVESGFKNETSPAGATGFWQFVKPTAKAYGLEVNEYVDERYHLEKSTEAACKYLLDAKENLGNWTLAAASYNLGIPAMKQRVKDQRTNNYYEMYFNQETSRYLFRMLAMKIIFSNPKHAGFFVKTEELYQPYRYKTVEVDSSISSIAAFADGFGIKYKHIKILNPWLRDASLPNKERKKYQLKILQRD